MEAHEDNYNDNIEILYERLLPSCKVRTINALNTWRREYQDFQKFFHHFLSATIFEMSHRHNCGRQTIRDILDFREKLRQQTEIVNIESTDISNEIPNTNECPIKEYINTVSNNIDEVLPLFIEAREDNYNDNIEILYERLLPYCKVRTINVLNAWRQEYPDFPKFIRHFFSATVSEMLYRHNCGRKTINDILTFREKLHQQAECPNIGATDISNEIPETNENPIEEHVNALPNNIDEVQPLFLATLDELSSRSRNRIIQLLKESNNSLSIFYRRICDPNCINTIPTIGRKSKPEIQEFFSKAKVFLEQFQDEKAVSSRIKSYLATSPSALSIPDDERDFLLKKEVSIGHFPLFAAIKIYLDNRPADEKAIIEGCMRIYQNQKLPNRCDVAYSLNFSIERIRQKRNKLIKKYTTYFESFSKFGFISENPYRFLMTHIEKDINESEGTDFNLNFVCWVLGCVFEDLTTIGNIVKSIGGYYCDNSFLCVVHTRLSQIFDFEAFIQDLDNRMQEKRINEEKVKLSSIINSHIKVQYCEEDMPMIDTTCRTILYLHYPVEIDQGYIILPANAYKTNPIIVEEILRAGGKPMTLAEITEEYMYLYPERDSTDSSLRGAINGNINIVPIGRSSTYALAEWNLMEKRGGTIRSFVQEFIDATPEKIATTASIAKYVMQFRPDTNEQSIVSNISLDSDKKFLFYYKDGVRYIGYSDMTYSDEYFPLESNFRIAGKNSYYYPKFLEFVKTHHRYPFFNGVENEEHALRSFWARQESRYAKGMLDSHAVLYYEKINREYGHLNINKSDFIWRVQFVHAAKEYGFPYQHDTELLDVEQPEDTETWLNRSLEDYYYRQRYTASWKIEQMRPFAEFLKNEKENV